MNDITEAMGLSEHDVAVLRLAIRHGLDDPCQPFEVLHYHDVYIATHLIYTLALVVHARRSGSIRLSFSIATLRIITTSGVVCFSTNIAVLIAYTLLCAAFKLLTACTSSTQIVTKTANCYYCYCCRCCGRYCRAAARFLTTTY
jgi:hypothetical protein